MKIAVIGSGIAGLSAAHHLIPHHESGSLALTLFEADRRTGGHANTVEVGTKSGPVDVDTGFIVFNRRNYPVFGAMLEELEVPSKPSNMSFSVSDGGGFEYTGRSVSGLFADRRNLVRPRFLRMLAEVPVFQRRLRRLIDSGEEVTLDEFLQREGFSRDLRERVVVPMVASVWSADREGIEHFPARFLARFLDNHGLLDLTDRPEWRTVEGGSRSYVERVLDPVRDRVHTGSRVESVRRTARGVGVKVAGRPEETFDQVVMATHAPETLRLMCDPDPEDLDFLAKFPYRMNEAVLHTDKSVMPVRRSAWASWNYRVGAGEHGLPALTYDMNRLQALSVEENFFVSLNMTESIDPDPVIDSFRYEHPVFTPEGVSAQGDWEQISGRGGIHLAGAWLRNGFHEDGAFTGRRAAEAVLSRSTADPGLQVAA